MYYTVDSNSYYSYLTTPVGVSILAQSNTYFVTYQVIGPAYDQVTTVADGGYDSLSLLFVFHG